MAIARTALRRVYIGNESAPGTAVAATEVMLGRMSAPYADKTMHYPEQDRGTMSRHYGDDFVVQRYVEGTFDFEANTRHILHALSNSVRGNITPTQPDPVNEPLAYLWTFEPNLTSPNTPDETNGIDTFTLEYGDNVQAYEIEYVFCRTLTISASPNEPVMVSWEWGGRRLTETTFTPALTVQPVQYFPANTCQFYIDNSYATIGTTEKSCLISAWTWTFETMFTARFGAGGQLYFCDLNEGEKTSSLELTFRRDDTDSEAEKDKFDNRTTAYLRVRCNGQTEIDSGEGNLPYIYIDGAFKYTAWGDPTDEDGTVTEVVTAESVEDATASKQFTISVLTDRSTLP